MARINITGFTNYQATGKSRKGVIGLSGLLQEILEDMGHIAGKQLENADLNIVSVLDLSSINASNAVNCLKLLRNEKCIIAFDDWQIRGFYKGLDKILETKQFSKTHHTVDYKGVLEYIDVIEKLAKGEYKSIFPANKNGDHELLEIRGDKTCIDPSIYVEKLIKEDFSGELVAIHASLATKWKDLEKKKYSILNVRNESEDAVFDYYCKHRIVLSPPHYHNGSGWWRNRYDLANRANAVIVEDYGSVFGKSYEISRKDVNIKNIDKIFEIQNEAYTESIMDVEEIQNNLKKVLDGFFED